MSPSPSTLLIPVEIQVRELDAKVLLAAVAAERGFPVLDQAGPFLPLVAGVDGALRGLATHRRPPPPHRVPRRRPVPSPPHCGVTSSPGSS